MRWLLVLAGLLLAGIAPAHATVTNTFEYYTFTGTCTDCNNTPKPTATLELENYTLGDSIGYTLNGTTDEFVKFTYGGSNLLAGFVINSGNINEISGSIGTPLPGAENINIQSNGGTDFFFSLTSGSWCAGSTNNCGDQGSVHVWSAGVVPEPASLALFGSGLLAVSLLRRRRRA